MSNDGLKLDIYFLDGTGVILINAKVDFKSGLITGFTIKGFKTTVMISTVTMFMEIDANAYKEVLDAIVESESVNGEAKAYHDKMKAKMKSYKSDVSRIIV